MMCMRFHSEIYGCCNEACEMTTGMNDYGFKKYMKFAKSEAFDNHKDNKPILNTGFSQGKYE